MPLELKETAKTVEVAKIMESGQKVRGTTADAGLGNTNRLRQYLPPINRQ